MNDNRHSIKLHPFHYSHLNQYMQLSVATEYCIPIDFLRLCHFILRFQQTYINCICCSHLRNLQYLGAGENNLTMIPEEIGECPQYFNPPPRCVCGLSIVLVAFILSVLPVMWVSSLRITYPYQDNRFCVRTELIGILLQFFLWFCF